MQSRRIYVVIACHSSFRLTNQTKEIGMVSSVLFSSFAPAIIMQIDTILSQCSKQPKIILGNGVIVE